jgi:hopanoid biosynthesis associated RND transporter like protein HpnN
LKQFWKRITDRLPGLRPIFWLVRASIAHPVLVLVLSILLALASVWYTVSYIDFKTSRNDMVSQDNPAVKRFSEISDKFGRQTNATVVIEGLNPERMKAFILDLAARLEKEPEYFSELFYRLDVAQLEGKKLLYLSTNELADLKMKLEDYGELIEDLAFTPKVNQILTFVNQKISEATVTHLVSNLLGDGKDKSSDPVSDANVDADSVSGEKQEVDLAFLRALLTQMRLALGPEYYFESPWDTFFSSASHFSEAGFLFSDNQRFAFMTLNARSQEGTTFAKKKVSLDRLRQHIRTLLGDYPDLKAGVTGGTALSTDEMSQSLRDMAITSIIAAVGVGILFIWFFGQLYNPLLVVNSLIISICWTYGWLTLTVGHLTILSAAFASILIGMGDDYGTHALARYLEERRTGLDFRPAMDRAYQATAGSMVANAVTTALAFFSIMLADFQGIRELGFIAGCGNLLQLVASFTVLPAAMTLVEQRRNQEGRTRLRIARPLGIFSPLHRHPRWVLGATVLLSLLACVAIRGVSLDYNLLDMQAKGTESVEWEKKLLEHSKRSSWFAVTTASSLDEVRAKQRAFKALPEVKKVDSLVDLLPEDQEARIAASRELAPLVQKLALTYQEPEPLEIQEIQAMLEKIQFKLRTDTTWDPQKKPADAEIAGARAALLELLDTLKRTDAAVAKERLEVFQSRLFRDFSEKFQLLKNNIQPAGPVRLEDVPESLRVRFESPDGHYLLQIFSRENIWEKENMTRFVEALGAVDPTVTGPPVIGLIAIDQMKKGYIQAGLYALLIDVLVVFWTFRNWKHTLLAMVPLAITTVWTLGWMGASGFQMNLANLISFPLIFGILVGSGIHLVYRYRLEPHRVRSLVDASTVQAINLATFTTVVGFGSLLAAKHYGIFSLGLLMTVTLVIGWALSLSLLPVMLILVQDRETRRG